MNREELKFFLLGEAAKLPNRDECREKEITESQLEIIAAQMIDFEPVENFISQKCYLGLAFSEIPDNICFQVVLFFILNTCREVNGAIIYYADDIIWNTADEDTVKKLAEIKKLIGGMSEINSTPSSVFLHYAKSNKPNF